MLHVQLWMSQDISLVQSTACFDCSPKLMCHPVVKWLKLIRWINRVLIGKGVQEGNRLLKAKKRCPFSESRAYVVTSHSHTQVYKYRLPQQDQHYNRNQLSRKLLSPILLLPVKAKSCWQPGLCCQKKPWRFLLASLPALFTKVIMATGETPILQW